MNVSPFYVTIILLNIKQILGYESLFGALILLFWSFISPYFDTGVIMDAYAERNTLKFSTRLVYDELKLQSTHARIVDAKNSLLEFKDTKGIVHYIFSTCSDKSSATGLLIARNKNRTAKIASELGIPIPHATQCKNDDEAIAFLQLHQRIVIKPIDNKGGVGVSTNIRSKTELKKAYTYARIQSNEVIAQQHLPGKDLRLLVVGGAFVSAVIRTPATITGNGIHTISQLITTENNSGTRDNEKITSLMSINIPAAKRFLSQKINDIPKRNVVVQVVGPANVSLGGGLIEATHLVPNIMKAHAEIITKRLGLGICGVDIIWDDESNTYGLIEVNAVPGIDIHDDPLSGTSCGAAKLYVEWLMK